MHFQTSQVAPLPKYTSQVVNRLLKPMSAIYHEITTVFATNKPTSLELVLQKHRDVLQRENNWGLAKQVQQSLYKKIIQRLTQTFLTLSLSDMALRVQLPNVVEAEKLVLTMVFGFTIKIVVNFSEGYVYRLRTETSMPVLARRTAWYCFTTIRTNTIALALWNAFRRRYPVFC